MTQDDPGLKDKYGGNDEVGTTIVQETWKDGGYDEDDDGRKDKDSNPIDKAPITPGDGDGDGNSGNDGDGRDGTTSHVGDSQAPP